jgi:dihydroorotate dehydrogenase
LTNTAARSTFRQLQSKRFQSTIPAAPGSDAVPSSTASLPPPPPPPPAGGKSVFKTIKNAVLGTALVFGAFTFYYAATDTRFSLHQYIVPLLLRVLYPDGEAAHTAGTTSMALLHKLGLGIRERGDVDVKGDLAVEVFGHRLRNPVGTSAGIDKGAQVPDALLALGGAYVEVGGVVPRPQEGNPQPRLFRIPSQNALINRFGLNSEGAEKVAARLRERVRKFAKDQGFGYGPEGERRVLDGEAGVPPGSLVEGKLMGVQVGKNKDTPDDIDSVVGDYVYCVERLAKFADVVVVNVSSPNTEGLRELQSQGPLTKILTGVVKASKAIERKAKPAVMVKVSPDEDSDEQVQGIVSAMFDSGVDGVIVGNTTKARPAALPAGFQLPEKDAEIMRKETGGYSGPQLFPRTVDLVGKYRKMLDDESRKRGEEGRKVIFGSGGITNGEQALQVLNQGADMVQMYTAVVYGGAGTISRVKREMREEIAKKGGEGKVKEVSQRL